MKEKERVNKLKPAGAPDGDTIFDVAPEPENKNVSVSSGPYLESLPVAGMTVGEVRRRFADRFDIDKQAQAIVDGNDADEDVVLSAGVALMFVRHAGEKGGDSNTLTIEGSTVTLTTREGEKHTSDLSTVLRSCLGGGMNTGECILPAGVRAVFSRGPITIWVWEQAPAIHKLSWIASDSPSPYGPGAKYRNVRIALPYVVIFAVFNTGSGLPQIMRADECFFRVKPLDHLDDELLYPGLLNCSKFGNEPAPHNPLSWICTQHLKSTKRMSKKTVADLFCGGFEAVRYCLLETSFNLSSEHHEGNSWYGASKKVDKRIETIESWEKATLKDPLFVLEVPWIKTNHSVKELAERTFKRLGATDTSVKTANDLARIIVNG